MVDRLPSRARSPSLEDAWWGRMLSQRRFPPSPFLATAFEFRLL
jgi:hypothetical protein